MKNSDLYEQKYWESIDKKLVFFPHAIQALDTLRRMGLKIAMLTDSDGKKEIKMERIKRLDLGKYFDYIITSDDVGKNKPAALNWEYLLKISGLKAKECIMVGDHPEVDLINAKKMGFTTVWTKEYLNNDMHWKYVDYEIHDIGEVVGIAEKFSRQKPVQE